MHERKEKQKKIERKRKEKLIMNISAQFVAFFQVEKNKMREEESKEGKRAFKKCTSD